MKIALSCNNHAVLPQPVMPQLNEQQFEKQLQYNAKRYIETPFVLQNEMLVFPRLRNIVTMLQSPLVEQWANACRDRLAALNLQPMPGPHSVAAYNELATMIRDANNVVYQCTGLISAMAKLSGTQSVLVASDGAIIASSYKDFMNEVSLALRSRGASSVDSRSILGLLSKVYRMYCGPAFTETDWPFFVEVVIDTLNGGGAKKTIDFLKDHIEENMGAK